jgi:hypothetical protein
VIRQKNGADTLYTLHTSRSSDDLLLTNEELLRVASRRREVIIPLQKPFRGRGANSRGSADDQEVFLTSSLGSECGAVPSPAACWPYACDIDSQCSW